MAISLAARSGASRISGNRPYSSVTEGTWCYPAQCSQRWNSGKRVLKVRNLGKNYGPHQIFSELDFEVQRGEKIAVIGANGAGKSTLIKILQGILPHDKGNYEWGHATHISYFSQDHHDTLDRHTSIFEWISNELNQHPSQSIRKTLGRLLFTQDAVNKDILTLSGGESARLLLAKIMLEQANILILDEPTNHLDIDSTEALANALSNYSGTLIIVSHNRHFISQIATRIFLISKEDGLQDFRGSYSEFEALNQSWC